MYIVMYTNVHTPTNASSPHNEVNKYKLQNNIYKVL